MKLTMPGGSVEIPADDLVSVEPEDTFQALPAPSTGRRTLWRIDPRRRRKAWAR